MKASKTKKARPGYTTVEVYVPANYRGAFDKAEVLAKKFDRSLSRYICLAVQHYNEAVERGGA